MSDQKIRELALDPTKSFIVKAPAGSGKTELLTRRFLRLLTTVNEPEEIIAVTFTRKAASEMRQRIIERLPHSEAARCNEKFEWRLIENPNRLRIMTIDALCAMMANQMPILSHSGGKYEISDDSKMDYEKTIDDLLAQTQSSDPWYDSLKALLVHFDNRIDKVRKILALLLAKREQWLIYLADFQQNHLSIQRYFSERILRIIEQSIKKLENHFSNELKSEIENIYHQIGIDIPKRETAEYWKWMSENLLTKQNTWRKQFNKKNGFLSPSETKDKTEKITRKNNIEMMLSIMESLESEEELKDSLLEFTRLPDEILSENQAKILQSIGVILPVLIGFLELQFK